MSAGPADLVLKLSWASVILEIALEVDLIALAEIFLTDPVDVVMIRPCDVDFASVD